MLLKTEPNELRNGDKNCKPNFHEGSIRVTNHMLQLWHMALDTVKVSSAGRCRRETFTPKIGLPY